MQIIQREYAKSQSPIIGRYSSPLSRYYRLEARTDKVPRVGLPYEFVDSNKRITSQLNRAFKPDGPATALFSQLEQPYFYSLYGEDLGIPLKYRHARCVRSKKALKVWRDALQKHFTGPYFFKFEVALEAEEVHVHGVGEKWAALIELVRDSEKCKPVTDAEGLMRYLMKPACYCIRKRVDEFLRAEKRLGNSKMPETSGYRGLQNKPQRVYPNTTPEMPLGTVKTTLIEKSCIYRAIEA